MIEQIINDCTVKNNVVILPDVQLDRKDYEQVKKKLEGIGGKWKGGKIKGFVFSSDPTNLLNQIQSGEKINLKKDFQFFRTPDHIANKMVQLANIKFDNKILEPSAGDGSIINAIRRAGFIGSIDYCELMENNRLILEKQENIVLVENDFLLYPSWEEYDRIIANPPFSNNQDIDHIMKMYHALKDDGIIVSICSTHYVLSNNKKETEFRDFLDRKAISIEDIEPGEFKESGTMIATKLIVIEKK